jgi:hypothetical protein
MARTNQAPGARLASGAGGLLPVDRQSKGIGLRSKFVEQVVGLYGFHGLYDMWVIIYWLVVWNVFYFPYVGNNNPN